jgi:tRNA threonylcarbamoyladenosine biosynthesis protein TsaB
MIPMTFDIIACASPFLSQVILAFDTSGNEASVALWAEGKMRCFPLPWGAGNQTQAARLLPLMQDLLKEANLTFQDIHVIATPTGPGSFTGIRLGLATAQGLLTATSATGFAPSTFYICAFDAWKEARCAVLVTLTTKQGHFYTQAFDQALVPLSLACIQNEEEIQDFLMKNPTIHRVERTSDLSAVSLIDLYFYLKTTNQPTPSLMHPYYLHDPEFVKKKPWSAP